MKDLKGKTAIVTGGGGGIGGATSRRFAEEGAQVAVFDMNLEAAQKVADGIVAAGGKAQALLATSPTVPRSMRPWRLLRLSSDPSISWSTTPVGTSSNPSPKPCPPSGTS